MYQTSILYSVYAHILSMTSEPENGTISSPIPRIITQPCRRENIIHVNQIHAFTPQYPQHRIPRTHRPIRQIPIPHPNPLPMRDPYLLLQQRELHLIERRPVHRPERTWKIRTGSSHGPWLHFGLNEIQYGGDTCKELRTS